MWSAAHYSLPAMIGSGLALLGAGAAATRFFLHRLRSKAAALARAGDSIPAMNAAAKSRMIATASHELRTPLNGILGMTELLQGTQVTPEQFAYTDAIRTSATALIAIVDELLDVSRIEAGRTTLADERFDPALLVEEVAELLAPRAQGKGLEIASYVAADVPETMRGDRGRLRQILLNLAGNATKFTETGGVGIRLSRGAGGLVFDVADTGHGIAPELRPRLFGDYERGTESDVPGSGLGLAISRRLAAGMGGTLTLEDTQGEGALFRLALPFQADPAEHPSSAFRLDEGTQHRALVIAHSVFEAPYLCDSLTDAGFEALSACPETAMAWLAGGHAKPDLVIVDCSLGLETTQALAAALQAARIPRSLLMFSPFERRAFGQATIRDFDGWLVKPIRNRSLLSRLISQPVLPEPKQQDIIVQPRPHAGLTVLLAEDDEINALIAMRHLERLGAQVARCRNGSEAISLAAAQSFDLVFLDLNMPDQDGFEAAIAIRATPGYARKPVPLIALTAERLDRIKAKLALAGFDEALEKPANFREMSRIIETILSKEADSRASTFKKLSNSFS